MKKYLIIDDDGLLCIRTAELLNTALIIDDDNLLIKKDSELFDVYLNDFKIYKGLDLYDADSYIYDAGMSFDFMIIDFAFGDYDYEFEDEEDIAALDSYGADKKYLVGWVWIKRFLREHPNFDKKRIVGLSAYTDLLDKREVEEVGIKLIDKKSSDSARLLLETVRSI